MVAPHHLAGHLAIVALLFASLPSARASSEVVNLTKNQKHEDHLLLGHEQQVGVVYALERRALRDPLGNLKLEPQSSLARLIYDDWYMRNKLDDRYPYLKLPNGTYLGIRNYFDFDHVFWPTRGYLERVNIEQVMYDEMRALELTASTSGHDSWLYSDASQLETSGGHLRDPARCRAAMASLEAELARAAEEPNRLFEPGERNMEFLRWIDSWGRPPPETYLGTSFWTGSYRACRDVRLDLAAGGAQPATGNGTTTTTNGNGQTTRFNFCWVKLAPRGWPEHDLMRPKMSMKVGVCLPDSCDTIEARELLQGPIARIMHFNFAPLHRERFTRFLDVYCLPVRPDGSENALTQVPLVGGLFQWLSVIPNEARVFLLSSLAWLLLIGYCSLRHGDEARSSSWLRLLSFQENYRVLSSDDAPRADSRIDLRTLGLPRLLASLLVVLGHSFIQIYYSLHSARLNISEGRKYGYHLFALTWKSVEIFFVLSGILTSYSIVGKFAPRNQLGKILKPHVYVFLNIVRFLRIAPLMLVAWTFVRTTFLNLSEGPYWDYGTNRGTFMGACQRISWWRWLIWPIIYDWRGNTGDPYQHECLPISWYVVTDLKMFLVVPLYVYVSYTWPKWRWPTLVACFSISTLWRLAHLSLQQLLHMRQIYTYGEMHASHVFITFLDSGYYSPVDRFQALALGLTAGLYLYEFKLGKLTRWPWWMRGRAICALLVWLAYDSVRRLIDEFLYRHTGRIPSDAYIAFWLVARPRLDAIIATILILRLCTDWAPAVMRHALVFYKLSKVSYCVYVIHSLAILYAVSSHERARPDAMAVQIFILAAYVSVISFSLAFPLFLFVESPITLLVDHFVLGAGRLRKVDHAKQVAAATARPPDPLPSAHGQSVTTSAPRKGPARPAKESKKTK